MSEGRGVNPAVALQVRPPGQEAGGAVTNPLGAVETLANVQNAINRNQLFQLEMAGRRRYGEIISGSPDLETGLNTALRDPVAGAYAAQLTAPLREAQLALVRMHGEVQTQATSGWNAVGQVMPAIMNDPNMTREKAQDLINAKLGLLSPEARERVGPQIAGVQNWIWDGSSGNSPADFQARKMKISGALGAFGMSPGDAREWAGGVRPEVTWQPGYPGGAPGPFQVGGPPGAPPTAPIPIAQPQAPGVTPPPGTPTALPAGPGTPTDGRTDAAVNIHGQALLPGETAAPVVRPPQQATGIGITPEQAEQQKTLASSDASVMKDMAEYNPRGDMLAAARGNAVLDALKMVKTGGFTAMGVEAGRWVTGFGRMMGWDPKTTESIANQFAGGNLSEAQMLRHLLANQSIQALKDAMTGTGRVMRPEVDAAMKNLNVDMQPEAIWHLLNEQVMPLVQQSYDMGAKWPQYREAVLEGRMPGLRIGDFPTWSLTRLSRDQRIQATPDGIRLGRRDISEMPSWETPPRRSPQAPAPAPTPAPSPQAPGRPGFSFGTPPPPPSGL